MNRPQGCFGSEDLCWILVCLCSIRCKTFVFFSIYSKAIYRRGVTTACSASEEHKLLGAVRSENRTLVTGSPFSAEGSESPNLLLGILCAPMEVFSSDWLNMIPTYHSSVALYLYCKSFLASSLDMSQTFPRNVNQKPSLSSP
jgi:hypothetical protein